MYGAAAFLANSTSCGPLKTLLFAGRPVHDKAARPASHAGSFLRATVSGTNDILPLVADPKNAAAYKTAESKTGRSVTIRGVMDPLKDLKKAVLLQINQIQ